MRLLYSLLWYALLPLLFARLWWRGRRAPAYRRRWRERLALGLGRGRLRGSVWIHAVSVGETLAAAPLIEALLARHPDTPLVVTTTTPTGSERVQALFGDRVTHVYCPWELPAAYRRFWRAFDPRLVVILETELWPNLCAAAKAHGARLLLMNGRLSENSYRGYRRLPKLVRPMLARFDLLAVQTRAEADRFQALGADPERIRVNGSVKFDLTLDDSLRDQAAALRQRFAARPVWIAASTHPGEDEPVLALTRAWTLVRFFESDLLEVASCKTCSGHFVVHAHTPSHDYVCGICQPPSRAGKTAARRKAREELALEQSAAVASLG